MDGWLFQIQLIYNKYNLVKANETFSWLSLLVVLSVGILAKARVYEL